MFGITGLVRYGPDRAIRDSLRVPEVLIDVPRLIASVEGSTSMNTVPFSPTFVWTLSPHGRFVAARTDVYAIELTTPGAAAVTRVEMDARPVQVAAAEKANLEDVTTSNMRQTDPKWRWNGPPIPDTKPYLRGLSTDYNGRIWVSLSRAGEEIPVDERAEPRVVNGVTLPVRTWREPSAYDVFAADGRYLGRVPMPPRSTWRAARGNLVWAVTRDSLDVEQITRFRVTPGFER